MSLRQGIIMFLAALALVGLLMGGLMAFLVLDQDRSVPSEKAATIECPEGQNTYLCLVRSYLKPQEPVGI